MRETTEKRSKELIKEFQSMLRCGKDYTTDYMYQEAAAKVFLAKGTAGNIVREHYRNNVINDEMKGFVFFNIELKHEELVDYFAENFHLCKREARLILRYISHAKK